MLIPSRWLTLPGLVALACTTVVPAEPTRPTPEPAGDSGEVSSVTSPEPMNAAVSDATGDFPAAGSLALQETPTGTTLTLALRSPARSGDLENLTLEVPLTAGEARDLAAGAAIRPVRQFARYPVSVVGAPSGGYLVRAIDSIRLTLQPDRSALITVELGAVTLRLGAERPSDPANATLVARGIFNLSCGLIGMRMPDNGYTTVFDANLTTDYCRNAVREYGLSDLAAATGHPIP